MLKWCAKWKIFLDFVLKRFEMAWSVSDLIWSVSKCFEAFQNVLKRFEFDLKRFEMSWSLSNSIWSLSKLLEAFWIRFEAFRNGLKRFEMTWSVLDLIWSVLELLEAFWIFGVQSFLQFRAWIFFRFGSFIELKESKCSYNKTTSWLKRNQLSTICCLPTRCWIKP